MNSRTRNEAIQQAQEYLAKKPVYLDTETTGLDPMAEILEISIVDHDGNILVNTLVKPRGKIDPGASRVHGITEEMLAEAQGWDVVWPQVDTALNGRYVGIYNLDFDVRMMQQSHQRNWMQWGQPQIDFFCIMNLYAQFYGQWNSRHGNYRWQSLDNARRQCGLNLPNTHRAFDDTLLARAVLQYMAAQ
ncbi:MAG: 3'-5' exonuclease [Anaerolineales bacterium]|nr:3'-5' exonuclease [Chloroflexota bacterium]MBL6983689.1 3'-5' exonuclease [Anaerolineales bacterium]